MLEAKCKDEGMTGSEWKGTVGEGESYRLLWGLSVFMRVAGVVMIFGVLKFANAMKGQASDTLTWLMWLFVGVVGCGAVYMLGEIARVFREKVIDREAE